MFDRLKSLIAGKPTVTPDQLLTDGKLRADAIDAAPGEAAAALLATPAAPAAAIIAGRTSQRDLLPTLLPLLDQEGLTGRAAAWALARLGAQAELLAAAADGGLDRRDNAYWGLAVIAATGAASPALAAALRERVATEIAKARSGATGLGEHAVRALAVLGDAEAGALAQAVVDGDRYCDRFELQRIKKAVADGQRDSEGLRQFAAPWRELFADHLHVPAPEPAPASAPTTAPVSDAPPSYDLGGGAPPADAEADADADEAEPPPPAGKPIDWKTALASPEMAALPAQVKPMAGQLGQLIEQLAQRAIGAQLADLTAEEFAGLLTQVLPQALPPQHVQAALSPQAVGIYQALAKYLIRTGVGGAGVLAGVKLVRKMMQEQVRRAGIIGGPDYSDPDDKPVVAPAR